MEEMAKIKNQLRAKLLEKRGSLPGAYVEAAGAAIQDRILASALYAGAESLFVYVSVPGEPATDRIIRRALADGKQVYVPRCRRGTMSAVRIRDNKNLRPGAMGIPEPQDCAETRTAEELDLILVPCVSASLDGRRLGHGGGYYDRFLAGTKAETVCLCFSKMLCPDLPMEETDVPMKQVWTETEEPNL